MIAALALVLLFSSCGGGGSAPSKDAACDPPPPPAPPTHTETTCLTAGQYMLAGQVTIVEYNNYLDVILETGSDWEMTESHVHAGLTLDEFPLTKKGSPIPGHFEYSDYYDPAVTTDTYAIPKEAGWDSGVNVLIAVHAVTWPLGLPPIVSDGDGNTMVVDSWSEGGGLGDELSQYPWHQNYPGQYPFPAVDTWEAFNNAPDTGKSDTWDTRLSSNQPWAYTMFQDAGADWIWEKLAITNPRWGDVVFFQRAFEIPGIPTSGTLYITADNGYDAYMNATFVGGTLWPGWATADGGDPDIGEDYVDGSGYGRPTWDSNTWADVETFDVTAMLSSGANVLDVTAVNELMGPGDYGEPSRSVGNPPPPQQPGGTYYHDNPGGLIYLLSVEYITDDETAWAGCVDPEAGLVGIRFVEKGNWATYVMFPLQLPQVP